MADALHQAAVAHEHPGAVVDDRVPGAIELRRQQLLGERHADCVREPLPERPGGRLDPGGHANLRMARGLAVQLPEAPELLERQRVAGQVQQRVQQHRAMAVGEHEAVAVRPAGIGGIVLQIAAPQRLGDLRHAHRHARVPALGGLHGIDGEHAQRVAQLRARGGQGSYLGVHAQSPYWARRFMSMRRRIIGVKMNCIARPI